MHLAVNALRSLRPSKNSRPCAGCCPPGAVSQFRLPQILGAAFFLLFLMLFALGCGASADHASKDLHAVFTEEWEHRLRENPLHATAVGDDRYNDRLPDFSPATAEESYHYYKGMQERLQSIAVNQLSEEDRISLDVFLVELQHNLDSYETGSYLMPFNADSGFHIYFARLGEDVPLRNEKDYRNYIARLRAWPAVVDGLIELMQEGARRGITPPAVTMQGYEATMAAHIVGDPKASALYAPFAKIPSTIAAEVRATLRREGEVAIAENIVPGYRKLHGFFLKDYLPSCRSTLAASNLPNGADFYQREIRYYTTLELSPDQIHEIGIAEVARIKAEMTEVMRSAGFSGTLPEFIHFLRTDPRFYAKTPDELLQRAAWIAKRMDGALPALFGKLPRQPYTVEPVPDAIAPKYTAGRYVEAPQGGTKAGIYWVNTYALPTRPFYALEALTLHEAVPGHHLQIALASEMEGLPPFRRSAYFSAFGEGWGLYAERLGKEAGFYLDPYSDFGRLSYEMWRACRLVVDTGVHAKGWTRQQMIDYLMANTALSQHECTTETDRYISWPAQALSYKLGEIKIRELRARAERGLGERFDLRTFHDRVLANGAIPLPTLARVIDDYIGGVLSKSTPAHAPRNDR